jgi:RNA polymerase sigma-70 factor (ECF subfamily)
MSLVEWPDPAREQELHAALLKYDSLAWDEVASAFLSPLTRYLLDRNPHVDPHLCHDAADRALCDYLKKPAIYDSLERPLGSFLQMSAGRDLKNALKQEGRHFRNRGDFIVELPSDSGNEEETDGPAWDDPRLQQCLAELNEADRAAIELMRDGERSTPAFAAIWGCSHLTAEEQKRAVKQHKDRLLKWLRRRMRTDG